MLASVRRAVSVFVSPSISMHTHTRHPGGGGKEKEKTTDREVDDLELRWHEPDAAARPHPQGHLQKGMGWAGEYVNSFYLIAQDLSKVSEPNSRTYDVCIYI